MGSLVAQVGGDLVDVTSIVTNPGADPHDYEPTAEDARTLSTAQYVIFNGVGYDEWARKVVDSKQRQEPTRARHRRARRCTRRRQPPSVVLPG